jgi:hypothetical protein
MRAIALVVEAVSTSETSVNFYQTTRRYNAEDSHLQCWISFRCGVFRRRYAHFAIPCRHACADIRRWDINHNLPSEGCISKHIVAVICFTRRWVSSWNIIKMYQMKEDRESTECSTHGKIRCVQNFGWKIKREVIAWYNLISLFQYG